MLFIDWCLLVFIDVLGGLVEPIPMVSVVVAYNKQMSLKDFVILSKLGEGAYSSVYKVQRVADSQIYALKKVKMNNLSDKEQENALNEVRILASIKSPYIVGYKQAFV